MKAVAWLLLVILIWLGSPCQTTEYQDGVNCTACYTGCTTCFSSTNCQSCDTLYYWDSNNNTCSSCPTNCINCTTSSLLCDNCKPGYLMETNGGIVSCVLYWWYIFLIIFGVIIGVALISIFWDIFSLGDLVHSQKDARTRKRL